MSDKTLGAYTRHESPDAPECDRHIAHIATQDRVLRHRNRTIRDLTQERDEARATKDMHKRRADEERARAEKAEKERDEARGALRARLGVLAEPSPLTAREHLDAAWDAAHVPADGMIPAGAKYITRNLAGGMRGPFTDGGTIPGTDPTGFESRRLLDPPAPARPERAEEIDEPLRQANAAALGGALTPEQRRALADHLAAMHVRVVGEDGAA